MSGVSNRTKHKAQIYDLALQAFFKVRELDAYSLDTPKADIGWDVAEAMVAAAISGVTYKTQDSTVLIDAAMLLRGLADQVEQDGLSSLEWGYRGDLLARHASRPDIRTPEGLDELDLRTDAVIEGMMGTARALTVPERRAIVCLSFVRMAMAHVSDLIEQELDSADLIRTMAVTTVQPCLEGLQRPTLE